MFRLTSLNSSNSLWVITILLLPLSIFTLISNSIYIIEIQFNFLSTTQFIFPIILDFKRTFFSLIVLIISANVLKFSQSYISEEIFLPRFTYLVILFVTSINLLIYVPHIISLLLGWDGLGIISFILVIYYQSPKSLARGIITALRNRIGDAIIIISIAWTINQGHWSITSIWRTPFSSIVSITIILAALTKRAQIPFSRWLPAAIAAPTPVSALVHSSTLVTAGVYLLLRFYPFLKSSNSFHFYLIIIAISTILIAGIAAISETDIKKIIALSTLSQLGVIISRIAIILPNLAFFHLITHALFKALLFICAGTLISIHHHSQDLRFIGNLTKQIPLTTSSIIIANIALCGFPFLAGFYSKDLILESSTSIINLNFIIINILFLATAFTSAYTSRFLITNIWSHNMSTSNSLTSDENINNTYPIIFLTLGAIISGAITNWIIPNIIHDPIIPIFYKTLPIISTIIGIWIAITITLNKQSPLITFPLPHFFLQSIWLHTPISTQNLIKSPIKFSFYLLKTSDQGWIEIFSSQGINKTIFNISKTSLLLQNRSITAQLSITIIFIIPILFIYLNSL